MLFVRSFSSFFVCLFFFEFVLFVVCLLLIRLYRFLHKQDLGDLSSPQPQDIERRDAQGLSVREFATKRVQIILQFVVGCCFLLFVVVVCCCLFFVVFCCLFF